MQFNSFQFFLFFIIVFLLYLVLNHKWQNRMLLLASCVFYAVWDWRFLFLIFVSLTTDYFCSLKINRSASEHVKKQFLILSILVNLSILGFFKYFNFFVNNFIQLMHLFGVPINLHILNIVLPLGISFYILKTMSYTIDVYTERIKPTRNYFDYALFVMFFPVLLAGPIMRAGDLLRQVASPRKLRLDRFYEGCYLIFWGLFEKIFVADKLASIVNPIFALNPPYDGVRVLVVVYAFAFQIFCDFDGYSNIAMGIGKCMGFNITLNFNLPYFVTNPQDFWNRWHISLSNWLRDYLYTPIAMSKRNWGKWASAFALIVTFALCGLWHGAAWTFVVWGCYWGMLLIAYRLFSFIFMKIPTPKNVVISNVWFSLRVFFFFNIICASWLFFRAHSINQAFLMFRSLFINFNLVEFLSMKFVIFKMVFFLGILLIVQIFQYRYNDLMIVFKSKVWIRAIFYYVCFYLMFFWGGSIGGKQFIYFRF